MPSRTSPENHPAATPISSLVAAAKDGSRILAIAPLGKLDAILSACDVNSIVVVSYDHLTTTTLATVRPDLILAPLLAASFDIVDVGARLNAMGFRDRLRAFSEPLPDVGAVVREVRVQFSDIDFGVIEFQPELDPIT